MVSKEIPHDKADKMIQDWIMQKAMELYRTWRSKSENQNSTEDEVVVMQRLYSEFEKEKAGQSIMIMEDPLEKEDKKS